MNQELEKLIEYAIADGKVTKKERTVLVKKAAEIGISEDELMLELDAKLYLSKKDLKDSQRQQRNSEIGNLKTKSKNITRLVLIGLLVFIVVVITAAIIIGRTKAPRAIKKIEEALAIYDFEAARKASGGLVADYISVSQVDVRDMHEKILSAEVTYCTNNGAIDRALQTLLEYKFRTSFTKECKSSGCNVTYKNEVAFFNDLLLQIINQLEKESKYDLAVEYLNIYYKGVPVIVKQQEYIQSKYTLEIWELDYSERDGKLSKLN